MYTLLLTPMFAYIFTCNVFFFLRGRGRGGGGQYLRAGLFAVRSVPEEIVINMKNQPIEWTITSFLRGRGRGRGRGVKASIQFNSIHGRFAFQQSFSVVLWVKKIYMLSRDIQ